MNLRKNFEKFVDWWKNLSVEGKHKVNMAIQLLILVVSALVYLYGKEIWNPTDFDIQNYWFIEKNNFFANLMPLLVVAIIFPFVLGQLDWLNSKDMDDLEEGTLLRTSLKFKLGVSTFAGTVEELNHRAFLVYTAMAFIYFSNTHTWLVVLFLAVQILVLVGIVIYQTSKNIGHMIVATFIVGGFYLWFQSILTPNIVYDLYNKIYIPLYTWVFDHDNLPKIALLLTAAWAVETLRLVVYKLVLSRTLPISIAHLEKNEAMLKLLTPRLFVKNSIHAALACCLIFFMISQTDSSIILSKPFLLTAGIISAAYGFHRGHTGGGWERAINSWLFAYYAQHIAFTLGLVYIMVVHVLYDATLYGSEHLAQYLKDKYFR